MYHHLGRTSIYRSLSYLLRFLLTPGSLTLANVVLVYQYKPKINLVKIFDKVHPNIDIYLYLYNTS